LQPAGAPALAGLPINRTMFMPDPKSPMPLTSIKGFHSHIYYDESSIGEARALIEQIAQRFEVTVGRIHERPVGPHPDWSCQLQYAPEVFGQLVPWLALNRGKLVVFTHPETDDSLADHRDHAIWMGAIRPLDLTDF
jgi:aromatic ring-cleaving dioxygenase